MKKKLFVLRICACGIICLTLSGCMKKTSDSLKETMNSESEENITETAEKKDNFALLKIQSKIADKVISIDRTNEDDKSSNYVAVWKIFYKSDACKVAAYVAIPNDMLSAKDAYPCVILNRGGNRTYGMLEGDTAAQFAYNLHAIVCASQYRGVDGGDGADEFGGADVQDVASLLEICRNLSFINSKRIYMLGSSRGGMMTYEMLRTDKDIIAKAAVVSGVADLFMECEERSDMEELCTELIGGSPKDLPDEYEKRSATYWADEIDTPLLLIHSMNDQEVSYEQAVKLNELLVQSGKDTKLISRNDDVHGFEDSDLQKIKDWFGLN